MEIHLSSEAARYIEAHLARGHCRSASQFVDQVLDDLRRAEARYQGRTELWLQARQEAAGKSRDGGAEAR